MENENRKRIYVTDLGACPRKIQFREVFRIQEDAIHYETFKGSFVHKLFEVMGKKSSIDMDRSYWRELWIQQVYIPNTFRKALERELPLFEGRIKEFFTKNKVGKQLFKAQVSKVEEAMRIPVEKLSWNINTPQDIQVKYLLSGRPDYRVKNLILEIKSAKEIRSEHRVQALAYREIVNKLEPSIRHGFKVLCLGAEKPQLESASWRRVLSTFKNKNKLERQLEDAIITREALDKDPFNPLIPKRDTGECAFCSYFAYCSSIKATWKRNKI